MGAGDDTSFFSMEQGCPIHGDDHMKECTMCGAEFCGICHPKTSVCPECTVVDEEILEGGDADLGGPDFDDVEDLDEVLEDDFEKDEEFDEK